MADLVVRPLAAGEEELFDSLPDPLPELRTVDDAAGLASGGFHPSRTWVALRRGRVVARAAWVLPPGSVGEPWLERFDVAAEPEVGATLLRAAHEAFGGPLLHYAALPAFWRRRPEVRTVVEPALEAARLAGLVEGVERYRCSWAGEPLPKTSGRYAFRTATGADEIRALLSAAAHPDVLTGAETARVVAGVELATDPLAWLPLPRSTWRVALRESDSGGEGEPVGIAATAGDACFPQLLLVAVADEAARGELITDAVAALIGGAREVLADVDAHRVAAVADLERNGFRRLRSRLEFRPA